MIKKTVIKINHLLAEISGWALSAIMLLLIIDFVSRGLSMPIQGVGELAVFVMVSVVYLGIAHTEEKRGHVRVTALISRFSHRVENIFNLIVYVLALFTVSVVLGAVTLNAAKAYISKEAVAGTVPLLVWPVKFIIVIGCVFYFIQILYNTIEEYQKLKKGVE